MPADVDLSEVQGNILHGYGAAFPVACYLRLRRRREASLERARTVVAAWLGDVSFGRRPPALPDEEGGRPHLNVAFTYAGLEALELPAALRFAFPLDFREGAEARAALLGDRWPRTAGFVAGHVLLAVHAGARAAADAFAEALLVRNRDAGEPFALVGRRAAGFEPAGPREPFGFRDGSSQPAIEGVDLDPAGDGVYAPAWARRRGRLRRRAEDIGLVEPERSWRLISTGEFLLGHRNEDGDFHAGPPPPLGPNGTFMVYREMDQDVDAFTEHVATWARRLGLGAHDLAEKIVGRRRDGSPLVRPRDEYPAPDPATARDGRNARRRRSNDFLYAEDPQGFRCPLGAHVRRANPRDALTGGADRSARHRIIRRGIPYDAADGQAGLVFVCYGASLRNGFEHIQRRWINDGAAFGLDGSPDFLLQQPDADGRLHGTMVIPAHRPGVLPPPERPFVTVRGCEYLFVPSRSACAWLAGLES